MKSVNGERPEQDEPSGVHYSGWNTGGSALESMSRQSGPNEAEFYLMGAKESTPKTPSDDAALRRDRRGG